MEETKAAIRLRIRAGREERHRTGGEASRRVQRRALLSAWWAVLAQLGLDPASPSLLPALFVPTDREPDVSAILLAHPRSLLPVLVDGDGHALAGPAWGRHTPGSALSAPSPRRPAQPDGPPLGPQALGEADVILVAALAVDEGGSRLGQGGGWYDRALPGARPGVPVVAAVFEDEVFPARARPREPHDHGVDAAVTPAGARLLA